MTTLPTSLPLRKPRKPITETDLSKTISDLEESLIEAVTANASLNCLLDLVNLLERPADAHDTSKAIYALYRVFTIIITTGKLTILGGGDAKLVRTWIWDRLNSYVDFLSSLLKDEEKALRDSALEILFSLLKHLSSALTTSFSTGQPQLHLSHFRKIVGSLLDVLPSKRLSKNPGSSHPDDGQLDAHVRDTFVVKWLSVYDDIRWFFMRETASLLSSNSSASLPANLLSILERLNYFPTESSDLNTWWVEEFGTKPLKQRIATACYAAHEGSSSDEDSDAGDDWRRFFDGENADNDTEITKAKVPSVRFRKLTVHQSLHSLAAHRAVFTQTWLLLLPRLSISEDEDSKNFAVRALSVMHRGVLPHLTRPVLVMDWVGARVDHGATVGLLALNALFVLMKEHNLDYPSFYTRLYAFLDRRLLHSKHRARFFRMIDIFLGSTHLPATLLASFIKRLSRLSLNAPPSAIITIIPFTYNILKRHPALMVMIHRVAHNGSPEADCFLADEPNPTMTHALNSSLWELHSHKNHYYAPVSTLARVLSESFTKPGYSLEDFLDHTYGTLFDTETRRKIKKEPAAAMEPERAVFPLSSEQVVIGDSVGDLWTFG